MICTQNRQQQGIVRVAAALVTLASLGIMLVATLAWATPAAAATGGQVMGTVWVDNNGDGVRNSDETQALAHVTVALTDNNGTLAGLVTTDEQGRYVAGGLLPGLYQVSAQSTTTLLTSTPEQRWVGIRESQTTAVVDFGFVTPTTQALVSFSVTVGAPFVEIMWRTGNENEVQNFNIYRSAPDGSDFVLLTAQPLAPHGVLTVYSWYDVTATPGNHVYWLEFNYAEGPVLFGPRIATVSTPSQHLFLPRIVR